MVPTLKKIFLLFVGITAMVSCGKNDKTPPVITLNGSASQTLLIGGSYTESGATAMDDKDGDMTSRIELSGTVNTLQAGTYVIKYSVTDYSGNSAEALRVIYVKNTMSAYSGTYQVHDSIWGGPVTDYTENILASAVTNDRIIFNHFANLNNAAVYADYYSIGDQFNVPIQTLTCGTPALSRSISTPTPGTLLSSSPISFTLSYQVTEGMNTTNGTAVYVKQ